MGKACSETALVRYFGEKTVFFANHRIDHRIGRHWFVGAAFLAMFCMVATPSFGQDNLASQAKQAGPEMRMLALGQQAQAAYDEQDFLRASRAVDEILAMVDNLPSLPDGDQAAQLKKYGVKLHLSGHLFAAERLFYRAYRVNARQLGEYHPFTLSSLNNLASNLNAQGRYDEAAIHYQEVLRFRELILGLKDPSTMNAMVNLGYTYTRQGKAEQAEQLLSKALALHIEILGRSHPDTAKNMILLADLYDQGDRTTDAEAYYREALRSLNAKNGPFHPDTISCLQRLGDHFTAQGLHKQAEPFYYHIWTRLEQTLGKNHPDTISSRDVFAASLTSQGLQEEADKILGAELTAAE